MLIHVLESISKPDDSGLAMRLRETNTKGALLAYDILKLGFNDITGCWLDWPLSAKDRASVINWLIVYWIKHIPFGGVLPIAYHALGRHFGGQTWYIRQVKINRDKVIYRVAKTLLYRQSTTITIASKDCKCSASQARKMLNRLFDLDLVKRTRISKNHSYEYQAAFTTMEEVWRVC